MKLRSPLLLSALLVSLCAAALTAHAGDTNTVKLKPYTLKTCIVSGDKLGEMGDPFVYAYKGRQIKFCCKGCLKDFNKDPAKYPQADRRGRGQGQKGQVLAPARRGNCFYSTVKRLLAILFCVTLVWAQIAPAMCAPVAPAAACRPACACRGCGKANCCMAKTARHPQPLPAAPAPRAAQSLQFLFLAPASLAFVLPQSAPSSISLPSSSSRRPAAPPLYQQNCTFLI